MRNSFNTLTKLNFELRDGQVKWDTRQHEAIQRIEVREENAQLRQQKRERVVAMLDGALLCACVMSWLVIGLCWLMG
ncbi:MAG: hypothetical protein IJW45_08390 [Oscillospiraceae bacterium]|nr:hypothetical protein [Oscillospiraceae bacterium]